MSRVDFEKTQELLRERGLVIDEATYKSSLMGTWWVVVRGDPPLRIAWDGRDWWFTVARLSDQQRPPWVTPWDDFWVSKAPEDQTPAAAVEVVAKCLAGRQA